MGAGRPPRLVICPACGALADVARLVEHHLAKVGVAGSNPVVRSKQRPADQRQCRGPRSGGLSCSRLPPTKNQRNLSQLGHDRVPATNRDLPRAATRPPVLLSGSDTVPRIPVPPRSGAGSRRPRRRFGQGRRFHRHLILESPEEKACPPGAGPLDEECAPRDAGQGHRHDQHGGPGSRPCPRAARATPAITPFGVCIGCRSVPSAFTTNNRLRAPVAPGNARCVPSGDHAGAFPRPGCPKA
jgi:hypothetical protein